MSTQDDVNAFLQSLGAKSFPFDTIGDSVQGIVIDMQVRQQTDMETGEPQTWKDGSPKKMLVLTLQTDLQDDETDDGIRTLYLRGGNFTASKGQGASGMTALREGIKRASATEIETGARLTMTFTGLGTATNRAYSPPKLYTIEYEPPTKNVSIDDLA